MGKIVLTGKGRRWIEGGHPWAFRDDVASTDAEPGEIVAVEGPGAKPLGFGAYSSASRIAVRMVSRGREEPDRAFWKERVGRAIAARARAGYLDAAGACRLLGGDADGVPGLVVDRYASVGVLQSGTQGADRMIGLVVELLDELLPFPLSALVDRSDSSVRKLEALERRVAVVRGSVEGGVLVREGDLAYEVDVLQGHKTGHYLDQRENRRRAATHAPGRTVLDAFSYDGLFGIRAALAGASSVLCVDQSEAALARAAANAERNGVAARVRVHRANCMSELRAMALADERFGLVVVDPPAFARNRREVAGAARGYVEVNRRALALVEAGGMLVSASCSYNVRPQTFVDYLAAAAHEAGRDVYLEELAGASPDHPALLTLPESAYLKCAFLRVEGEPRMRGRKRDGARGIDDDRDRVERQEA
ncbi:MAG TPA: class I SAM-dependent rRNA methyltransferase [Planctomycetota bacterium]|jgi:23S rRNA (cytosine1962-C5)-methyltransferase|nr:class I SAM-dependent rRNA methyltransferase [Planctomycetota bacterium]